MGGDALLVEFFKTIIASPRTLNGIIFETGYSFLSGHTTSSVVLFGILVYVAWQRWKNVKVKVLAVGLYVSEVGVVGFDRIYLNVHWFSDVLGALFLCAFWVAFCLWMFKSLAQLIWRQTDPRIKLSKIRRRNSIKKCRFNIILHTGKARARIGGN